MKSKVIILLCFSILMEPEILTQTLPPSHISMIFRDYERDERKVAVEVYYPGEINMSEEMPGSTSAMKYPVLCFAHGYQLSWNSYSYLHSSLVPRGYIMVFPRSESGMFPSHSELARDIVFILEKMNEAGRDSSSMFYNHIDTMNCAMGHSMGGGCAVMAARLSPAVKSLAVLAPYEKRSSSEKSSGRVTVPSLIIAGSNDCITPPAKHQLLLFNNLEAGQSDFLTISGASHCQMADKKFICNLAEISCRPKPEIESEMQHSVVLKYLGYWLDHTLKGDTDSWAQFNKHLLSDTLVVSQRR